PYDGGTFHNRMHSHLFVVLEAIFLMQGVLILVFFFFFIRLIPQTSTLFPYTTLFRSAEAPEDVFDDDQADEQPQREPDVGGTTIDRKSTRLNSSHVKSSYAVFCLKKKK